MSTKSRKKEDPIEEALMQARQIKAAAQTNALSFLEEKVLRKSVSNRLAESIFREEEEVPMEEPEDLEDETISEEEVDQFLLDSEPVEENYFFEEDDEEEPVEDEEETEDDEELDEDFYGNEDPLDDFSDDEFLAGEDDSFVNDFDDDETLYDTDLDSDPFADEDPLDSSFDDDLYMEEEEEDPFLTEEDEKEEEPAEEEETEEEDEKETVSERRLLKLRRENRMLRRKLSELRKANKIMNRSINEVSLYNTKLSFSARLLNKHNYLTLEQKKRVLAKFKTAKSVNEVKSIFKALNEGLPKYRKQNSLKESKRRVSRSNPFKATPMLRKDQPKSGNVIVEKVANKYQKLAGLKD